MRRVLVAAAAALAAAALAPAASAGRECDGLVVCIPVVGPWVQVTGGASPTYYRLACPGRGQVIAGLDADRAGPLEITFLGQLGGPIGPGVTSGSAAVFVVRTTRRLAGFRPRLGCLPGGGGGGRGRTVHEPKRSLQAAAMPSFDATVRRVRNVRLKQLQVERVPHRCPSGERLLAFSTAVAFRTQRPPSLATLGSVRATGRRRDSRVVVTVRSGVARPLDTRVELQIHAICAKGPS